jgi:RNA polymerase-binding transcription factor
MEPKILRFLREGKVGPKELDHYKQILLVKKRELLAGKAATEAPVPSARADRGDLVDQATAAAEADVQVRLRQTDSRLLRAIEEALTRIERGTFGVCTDCGSDISTSRLNAVPWTHLCRDCKEPRQV